MERAALEQLHESMPVLEAAACAVAAASLLGAKTMSIARVAITTTTITEQ